MLRFDHVILAVADLDSAAQEILAQHGLASVAGGRHAGHGTANRIVPLGTDYLELVAVVDQLEAKTSPFGRWVGAHSLPGSRAGLCLRATDLEGLADRLALPPIPMSRTRPDGVVLKWRLLGMEPALEAGLPFFIEWEGPSNLHPGRMPAPHRSITRGIAWVELGGRSGQLEEWLGKHRLELRVVDGVPGVKQFGITTDDGELVL